MRGSIFMETTEIPPERTVGEIQAVLSKYGVRQIRMEYDAGNVTAVAFTYPVNGEEVPFRLPSRWKPLQVHFLARFKKRTASEREIETLEAKAKRVAWRQVLRWVEAQLALVDTEMVKMHEVFMPYAQLKDGSTIFEHLEKKGFGALALEMK